MENCQTFSVPNTKEKPIVIGWLRNEITSNNGHLDGEDAGVFNVPIPLPFARDVVGNWAVDTNALTITITQKPKSFSCGLIENYVKSHFNPE
jgi:hypothetical protein